jgi:predicted ATPase
MSAASPLARIAMVQSVEISNFRGFENLKVSDLGLINIIMGDNAVGKTAFLEALYLAISGSAQKPLNLKQWRGSNATFQTGVGTSVVEGIYNDLFNNSVSSDPIIISLVGREFENRKLTIAKTPSSVIIPTRRLAPPQTAGNRHQRRAQTARSVAETNRSTVAPILLTWTDQHGAEHQARVLLTPSGLEFEGTGETIPNCFMYAAQIPVPSDEAADHYSRLRRRREVEPFRKAFLSIFEQITDISADTEGGVGVLRVDVPWAKELLPLPVFSGGTNRAAAILLSIAYRKDGLVLVDEVESGIYHQRQKKYATAILRLSRDYQTQLFMTTHSDEWLRNFLTATSDDDSDIAFWRMERDKNQRPALRRFTVAEFAEGMSAGEMR